MRWDAARGFRFIRSPADSADIFLHKQDFRDTAMPREGLTVTLKEIHVGGKGPRAMAVQAQAHAVPAPRARPINATPAARPPAATHYQALSAPAAAGPALPPLMLAWAALIRWGAWAGRLPMMTPLIAPLQNLVTFFSYWLDKYAAQQSPWRTPEKTLHLFSLLGGWLGAWFAQQLLRQKSSKPSFRALYRVTVVPHSLVLTGWLLRLSIQHVLVNT